MTERRRFSPIEIFAAGQIAAGAFDTTRTVTWGIRSRARDETTTYTLALSVNTKNPKIRQFLADLHGAIDPSQSEQWVVQSDNAIRLARSISDHLIVTKWQYDKAAAFQARRGGAGRPRAGSLGAQATELQDSHDKDAFEPVAKAATDAAVEEIPDVISNFYTVGAFGKNEVTADPKRFPGAPDTRILEAEFTNAKLANKIASIHEGEVRTVRGLSVVSVTGPPLNRMVRMLSGELEVAASLGYYISPGIQQILAEEGGANIEQAMRVLEANFAAFKPTTEIQTEPQPGEVFLPGQIMDSEIVRDLQSRNSALTEALRVSNRDLTIARRTIAQQREIIENLRRQLSMASDVVQGDDIEVLREENNELRRENRRLTEALDDALQPKDIELEFWDFDRLRRFRVPGRVAVEAIEYGGEMTPELADVAALGLRLKYSGANRRRRLDSVDVLTVAEVREGLGVVAQLWAQEREKNASKYPTLADLKTAMEIFLNRQ